MVHVTFTNQTITIPGFGTVNVPDATATFDPAAVSASTSFAGTWMTTVPSSIKGNTFFSGHSVQIPAGLPGSAKPTWSGTITIDRLGVSVNWQWAAANYPGAHFSANDGALGVKSVDDNTLDPLYQNQDHAGTPENFKTFVVGGGTGGGGSKLHGKFKQYLRPFAANSGGFRNQQLTSRSRNARDEFLLSRAFSLGHHWNFWIFALLVQSPNLAVRLRRGRSLLIRPDQNATSRSFVVTEQLQHEWNRR